MIYRQLFYFEIDNFDDSANYPSEQYLEEKFLKNLNTAMKDNGIVIFNSLIREDNYKLALTSVLVSAGFEAIYEGKCEEGKNCIVFAQKITFPRLDDKLVIEEEKLIKNTDLSTYIKSLEKSSDLKWDSTMNLDQLVSNFELLFPKATNAFSTSETLVKNEKGELTSATKEMYLNDQAKIDKKSKKKSKKTNKAR